MEGVGPSDPPSPIGYVETHTDTVVQIRIYAV